MMPYPDLFKRKLMLLFVVIAFQWIAFAIPDRAYSQSLPKRDNFRRQNLIAWCIVPFDVKNRGPVERAEMLNGIGITRLAYDWRDHHVPTFDQEYDELNAHHIQLQAFWLLSGSDPSSEYGVIETFKFLDRRKINTQIWYMFIPPEGFDTLSQQQKIQTAASAVKYIANRASAIGCKVGLYNHEGWYGEPENQLAIIQYLKMNNIGLVYNFNHAQDQIDRFPNFFPTIVPYLLALNLAGLKKGDRRIYPIGEGDSEQEMIRIVRNSNYAGPIGIINEDTHPDAETGLKMNMTGLKNILVSLGDRVSAKTYK
jgi:hypothetical protein